MLELPENTLVIASHNPGKLTEIKALLGEFPYVIKSAADYELEEPEETEITFEGNATIKAKFVANATGLVSLSDDSGLVIPSLGCVPGVDSAYWGGPDRNYTKAYERIKIDLGEDKDPKAYLISVIALAWPQGEIKFFEGVCHGHISFPPRGEDGYAYDYIFVPDGYTETFAELGRGVKNKISHRANALQKLFSFLRNE
jgi:XTP/dITP diphosphohydrolase